MLKQKSILIGCGDPLVSPMLQSNINSRTTAFQFDIITVATTSHLKGVLKSLVPDLLILFFNCNKSLLADIAPLVNAIKVPVLCLINKFETAGEYMLVNPGVFTYPVEQIDNCDYLNSKIHSLFFIESGNTRKRTTGSLAEAAYQTSAAGSNNNLSKYVLELDQKVEILSTIKSKIKGLSSLVENPVKAELMSIVNSIKRSLNSKELWNDFRLFFEEADPNFLLTLTRSYPFLTSVDLKYCCYLKMNMTNDDIRKIFGISVESVRTHKHRLKKKMTLSKDEDLRLFLCSIQ